MSLKETPTRFFALRPCALNVIAVINVCGARLLTRILLAPLLQDCKTHLANKEEGCILIEFLG